MNSKHLMIDIETLSTHSSKAVLLSFAATPFDLWKDCPMIERSLLVVMPLAEQLLDGRQIDQDTLDFWRKQPQAARNHFSNPFYENAAATVYRAPTIELALRELHRFTNPEMTVWANGIVFDLGNIENLFGMNNQHLIEKEYADLAVADAKPKHSAGVPWKYNAARDYRTIIRMLPPARTLEGFDPDVTSDKQHDPVYDNHYQIKRLWTHAPESLIEDK